MKHLLLLLTLTAGTASACSLAPGHDFEKYPNPCQSSTIIKYLYELNNGETRVFDEPQDHYCKDDADGGRFFPKIFNKVLDPSVTNCIKTQ